jgi:hypothetical protein
MLDGGSATVPAGNVSAGLSVCGYEAAGMGLPELSAADQVYSSGLCPGLALEKGTMFPELINEKGELSV